MSRDARSSSSLSEQFLLLLFIVRTCFCQRRRRWLVAKWRMAGRNGSGRPTFNDDLSFSQFVKDFALSLSGEY